MITIIRGLGIGDWGLGQSPIPNPQSPRINVKNNLVNYIIVIIILIILILLI